MMKDKDNNVSGGSHKARLINSGEIINYDLATTVYPPQLIDLKNWVFVGCGCICEIGGKEQNFEDISYFFVRK
jgi:hypothetical protein